jgi:hypothetical protein
MTHPHDRCRPSPHHVSSHPWRKQGSTDQTVDALRLSTLRRLDTPFRRKRLALPSLADCRLPADQVANFSRAMYANFSLLRYRRHPVGAPDGGDGHDGLMFWREHDVCIFRGHGPLLRGTGVTGEEAIGALKPTRGRAIWPRTTPANP